MTDNKKDFTALIKHVNELLKNGEPDNISFDSYSGYSGYKPQFIVDAMNLGFGLGEWGFEEISSEIVTVKSEKGDSMLAVSQVRVFLKEIDVTPVGWGQARVTKGDIGDARKGAQTDAIKKALSYFSIGNRAYLGLLPSNIQEGTVKPTTQAYTGNHEGITDEMLDAEAKLHGPCKKCGAPMRISKQGNVVCSEACWLKK